MKISNIDQIRLYVISFGKLKLNIEVCPFF